ncbi:MAG: CMGC/CDK protein kinase [Amphiamblys sp. WSBS2006]|nr:MAG: CMGC/CDK protein kinase [Amphiamblys sp. WSBS2006]
MSRRYRVLEKIGEGTYGTVSKAYDLVSGKTVAIKTVPRSDDAEDGVSSLVLREIAILKRLDHPNVVSLSQVLTDKENVHLVLEYADLDLGRYLRRRKGPLEPHALRLVMAQLVEAVAYLHRNCVMHRDLKPQNILLTKAGEVKVADFGIAKIHTDHRRISTCEVVTLWYRPPEILLGWTGYGFSADMWSVGAIFFELATATALFAGESVVKQLEAIFSKIGTPDPESIRRFAGKAMEFRYQPRTDFLGPAACVGVEGMALMRRMLQFEPDARITAEEARGHRYFSQR